MARNVFVAKGIEKMINKWFSLERGLAGQLKSHMLLLSLGILSVGVMSSAAHADEKEVFYWDADSFDFVVDGASSSCAEMKGGSFLDTSEKKSGSSSLKQTFGDNQGDRGCDPVKAPKGFGIFDGSTIVYRAWIKFEEGFDWGTYHRKAKFAHLKRSNERTPVYGVIYISHGGFFFNGKMINDENIYLDVDLDQSDGDCRDSANAVHAKSCTEWRQYTVVIQQNTCPSCKDGSFGVYVDGVLADQKSGISFARDVPEDGVTTFNFAWAGLGGKAYPQMCANGSTCAGIGGSLWIDDLSISVDPGAGVWVTKPGSPNPLTQSP